MKGSVNWHLTKNVNAEMMTFWRKTLRRLFLWEVLGQKGVKRLAQREVIARKRSRWEGAEEGEVSPVQSPSNRRRTVISPSPPRHESQPPLAQPIAQPSTPLMAQNGRDRSYSHRERRQSNRDRYHPPPRGNGGYFSFYQHRGLAIDTDDKQSQNTVF